MKFRIEHEARSMLRLRAIQSRMTMEQADLLDESIRRLPGVEAVTVHERTCGVIIRYTGSRAVLIHALALFSYEKARQDIQLLSHSSRALNREYKEKIVFHIIRRYLKRLYLPAPIRHIIHVIKALPYAWRALGCLVRGEIGVDLLDGVAITASLLTGDSETAGSVMFLLKLGDYLDQWTHKKSVEDLARSMALNIDQVWLRMPEGDVLVPLTQVKAGDEIVVNAGSMIPLDGTLTEGEAMVNQASLTGESVPVEKRAGASVFAGTVVEEGCCVLQVKGQGSKYDQIVKMIEESEKLKSDTEARASDLADKLVPVTFAAVALTYLFTGDVMRAYSIMMVDFCCALKLAMPVSVLSAMREASNHGISVKGGKFMENLAQARTIIFDKTGTLTKAQPKVKDVIPFGGQDKLEMLRLAACLEEHYPHSIANAVVKEAKELDLRHEERHTKVKYIVAHGIASTVEGEEVRIGSSHFIFEDEGVVLPEGEQEKLDSLPEEYSHLYLSLGGCLAAVLLIEDPLKEEAALAIERLHKEGFEKVAMLTGDSRRTARSVAKRIGIDDWMSEVLPEDKASYIAAEHAAGRKVVMVGDGINDSPALSAADVGIAINSGAAIAREIADVTISEDDLMALVTLKKLCTRLEQRTRGNYRFILSFNALLVALGMAGVMQPTMTALLHNVSTIGIAVNSTRDLLPGTSTHVSPDVSPGTFLADTPADAIV